MPSSQNTEYSYFNYITVRAVVQYKIANLYLLLSKVSCSDKGFKKCRKTDDAMLSYLRVEDLRVNM
jgi:hypothetical protein